MEFLKAVLGDGYEAFVQSLNAYNDKNKDKPIKLANLTDGGYVDKGKFAGLETESAGYKSQLEKAQKDLDALKAAAKGNEELTKTITDLQAANKIAADKHAAELKAAREAHLLDTTLMAEKPKNLKALKALVDTSKLKFDGEKVEGLAEQLTALKASDAYLFGEAAPIPPGTGGFSPVGSEPAGTDWSFNFTGVRPAPGNQTQK